MKTLILLFLMLGWTRANEPYLCGEKKIQKRTYGNVQIRVECDYNKYNNISVAEFKGKKQHGFQIDYDTLWHKKDSTFFVNGKEEGESLSWDTLGNVIYRGHYHKGIAVGKHEAYWSPGNPSLIKNRNMKGEEDGEWKEWWENGNKKVDAVAKNGSIVSATEYFQDGTPRVQYLTKYPRKSTSALEIEYINDEAWAPNGKSTGKITNGSGTLTIFPSGNDPGQSNKVVRETYLNGRIVDQKVLDSTQVEAFLKTLEPSYQNIVDQKSPTSDSIRTEAYATFLKMARLDCTYIEKENIHSLKTAESECGHSFGKLIKDVKWRETWDANLKSGLTESQFDSLCSNFIRAFSGEMPVPVSEKIRAKAGKMRAMMDSSSKEMIRRMD